MRSDPTPRARRRLPYRPCPPPRLQTRAREIRQLSDLSFYLRKCGPPSRRVSWPPSRILDRATFVFIVPISVRQFDDGWVSKVLTSNLGRKLGRQKQFQILFLVLRYGTYVEREGVRGRCRLIAAGSRHQSIPEVWKYRIELGEVKYPRAGGNGVQSSLPVRVECNYAR